MNTSYESGRRTIAYVSEDRVTELELYSEAIGQTLPPRFPESALVAKSDDKLISEPPRQI